MELFFNNKKNTKKMSKVNYYLDSKQKARHRQRRYYAAHKKLSRACKSLLEAAEIRVKLIEKLDKKGILIHGDNLKTQMILKPGNKG